MYLVLVQHADTRIGCRRKTFNHEKESSFPICQEALGFYGGLWGTIRSHLDVKTYSWQLPRVCVFHISKTVAQSYAGDPCWKPFLHPFAVPHPPSSPSHEQFSGICSWGHLQLWRSFRRNPTTLRSNSKHQHPWNRTLCQHQICQMWNPTTLGSTEAPWSSTSSQAGGSGKRIEPRPPVEQYK